MLAVGNIDLLYVKREWVSGQQLSLACGYYWNVFKLLQRTHKCVYPILRDTGSPLIS